jgi:hypothetical protein
MKSTFRRLAMGSLCALGGAGLLGFQTDPARAQSACVERCRSEGWAANQCSKYCETRYGEPRTYRGAARTYGYYRSMESRSCGQYRYWKDGRCADARIEPPKVD